MGSLRAYSFSTDWQLPADPQRCWDELLLKRSWNQWWPGVRATPDQQATPNQQASPDSPLDVGSHLGLAVASPLGYSLAVQLEVTQVAAPHWIAVRSTGDLLGTGYASFYDAAPGTLLSIVWTVQTQPRWMNLLAPVAAGPFSLAHAAVMRSGEKRFINYLRE